MRLAEISWKKAEEYFKNSDAAIIAIGSIESHGTHNPLGVDTLIPNRLLELIEEKTDVLICPTIPYGACDTLTGFPGTISLSADVLYDLLTKITEGLYHNGVRKFFFVNGHGGNIPSLERVCYDLDSKGAVGVMFNWWLMAWDLNPAWKGGHGGAEETAAILAINPDLVDLSAIEEMNLINDFSDRFPTAGFKGITFKGVEIPVPRSVRSFTDNGWIGPDHPRNATEEWGKEMLQKTADYIAEFIEEFKNVDISKRSK